MDIFNILLNLYVNKEKNILLKYEVDNETRKKKIVKHKIKGNWIQTLEDTDIQPYVIQLWLVMYDGVRTQVRWLDKYVFVLPSKMYLSLAWSILPKGEKVPFARYIKKLKNEEEYDFILSKIRRQYKLSDNDYKSVKPFLLKEILNNMVEWFRYYGVEKKYWKKYHIDFRLIKEGKKKILEKGLDAWGI